MTKVTAREMTSQPNSTARARIIANLQIKQVATKDEKIATVLPRFVERNENKQGKDFTAEFIARATKLSCQFLPAPQRVTKGATKGATKGTTNYKAIAKTSLATTLENYLATYLKSHPKKGYKKSSPLPILIDGEQRKLLTELDVIKKIEPYCELIEVQKITDFAATPFPPFAIQQANYAIAETGSLVFLQNTRAQAALSFLATRHIVLLNEKDLLPSLEQAFARSSGSKSYWACITVSGPSRTADIEQELHMGAHGPKELLIILYR